jgi:hypothetical protein
MSLWTIRKGRKKEKGAYKKKKDPNSRAQPPRSGDCGQLLAQFPSKRGEPRSIIR